MNYIFTYCFPRCFNKKPEINIDKIIKELNYSLTRNTLDVFSTIDSPKYQQMLEKSITTEQPKT